MGRITMYVRVYRHSNSRSWFINIELLKINQHRREKCVNASVWVFYEGRRLGTVYTNYIYDVFKLPTVHV